MKLLKMLPGACVLLSAFAIPAFAAEIAVTDSAGLAAAVADASDDDVLVLSANTTYTLTDELLLDKPITVRGAGIDSTIIRQTTSDKRVVVLNCKNARIESCTITGASFPSELKHGVGLTIDTLGGTVYGCRITGNRTSRNHNYVVGIWCNSADGLVSHCRIDDNKTTGGSNNTFGGVRLTRGTMEYCLVTDNKGHQTGGIGVEGACMVKNCVFYGNEAGGEGGNANFATASAVFTDCIFAAGKCPETASGTGMPEWTGSQNPTFNRCAFPVGVTRGSSWKGTPFNTDAQFFDLVDFASRLAPEATADIGWKPYDRDVVGCDFTLPKTRTFQNVALCPTAVVNAIDNPSYVWTVTDPDNIQKTYTEEAPELSTDKIGTYTVSLAVSDVAAPITQTFTVYVQKVYPTTAADLVTAASQAVDGQEIILGAQTYEITSALSLRAGATIVGQGRGKTVVRQKTTSERVLFMSHPQALVEGITLVGKPTENEDMPGVVACIGSVGGTIRNCDITGGGKVKLNRTSGLGVALLGGGLVDHCYITNNVRTVGSNQSGGGVYAKGGTLESCLIAHNSNVSGGGIYVAGAVTVRNCTFANNSTESGSGQGGGVYLAAGGSTFVNCLFSGNTSGTTDASTGAPEWFASSSNKGTFTNCAFPSSVNLDGKVLAGAIIADAYFVDAAAGDYHVLVSSKTIDAGTDDGKLPETDLDGAGRVLGNAVDIGCFEFDPYTFSASFEGPLEKVGFKGCTNVYVAAATGIKEGESVTFDWTVRTSDGRTMTATGKVLRLEMTEYGDWTVGMSASSGGKTVVVDPVTYAVVPRVLYVKPPTPEAMAAARAPYDSWDTAATNILDAVALALSGAEVRLAEGEFPVKERIDLMAGVSLVGQGWTKTTVRQTAKTRSILYLNHEAAVVRGLTLTGMNAQGEIHSRGAVIIEPNGGIVEDCRITGNVYKDTGVNQACGIGITINSLKGICRRCIIDRNRGSRGTNNDRGGGVQGIAGLLENCLVCFNTNKCAGGISVRGPFTVRNCTVYGNVANGVDDSYGKNGGGGIVVESGATATIENTIFCMNESTEQTWDNGGYPEWRPIDGTQNFKNCCLTNGIAWPATATACVNGDPKFVDAANGDWHLRVSSPCCGKGDNSAVSEGAVDLDGNPRKFGRNVDIGCYECQKSVGFHILVR